MYFDSLTLAAVADEIRAGCVGGRIQRVVQTGLLGIGIEIYRDGRRSQLLLSAHPRYARVHLVAEKLSRGLDQPTPLLLLLRKYLLGGRLRSVEQPPLERVLVLSIAKEPQLRNLSPSSDHEEPDWEEQVEESDEALYCDLVAEIMEQRSNLILVSDDNLVLASARRVTPAMSRRSIEPHLPYELPPRQNKLDPQVALAFDIRRTAAESTRSLVPTLVGMYRGVSPQIAREVVFRATGQPDQPVGAEAPWEQLASALRAIFTPEARRPSLVLDNAGQPRAYAAYEPTHLRPSIEQPSISGALDAFYRPLEGVTAHRQRRDRLSAELRDTRTRFERQRANLAEELTRAADLDRLRWEGEMIFGFLHTLQPGQTLLEVEGRSISLDPELSPVENAQARFRAYDKARNALAGVPERLAATERQLASLDETMVLVELADSFEQIELLASEAREAGFLRAPRTSGKKKLRQTRATPLSIRSRDGFTLYIGRSAGQNMEVTFRIGHSNDLWLHTRAIPGAHVIIRSEGRAVPEATILEAAAYAAYYSGARNELAVDVDLCRRTLVRRIPDSPLGLVSYHAERTVRVAPQRPVPNA